MWAGRGLYSRALSSQPLKINISGLPKGPLRALGQRNGRGHGAAAANMLPTPGARECWHPRLRLVGALPLPAQHPAPHSPCPGCWQGQPRGERCSLGTQVLGQRRCRPTPVTSTPSGSGLWGQGQACGTRPSVLFTVPRRAGPTCKEHEVGQCPPGAPSASHTPVSAGGREISSL